MSGKVGGIQKRFLDIIGTYQTCEVTVRAPFVHCASHNLNLVINDAAEATTEGINFFGVIAEIFSFFGRSLSRWAELALTEDGIKKLKLKKVVHYALVIQNRCRSRSEKSFCTYSEGVDAHHSDK